MEGIFRKEKVSEYSIKTCNNKKSGVSILTQGIVNNELSLTFMKIEWWQKDMSGSN